MMIYAERRTPPKIAQQMNTFNAVPHSPPLATASIDHVQFGP